ncbi:hypothetical protein SEA_JENOS_62 [Microbacterium phage Jenos]|uniref:Uncharacterized protein n=1 Tax=Microbacterium phage McGalleon TaxID=2590936 RepID=A0A516KQZ3_9CAUD|nr:hypothetical protein H3N88_gp61 [Microbacterium phage McGalleon]QDP44112.1 hypothetical protein SEA_MCGALLEON_61 [Microbacterium phage McGalleon]QXO14531.1 hypothetical protein SEA_JENOS_62 [Microbacterium phage Jenos]
MNADRRMTLMLMIEVCRDADASGQVSNEVHLSMGEAIKSLKQAEYWSVRNIKPERNDSSAKQHAIATIALGALEEAYVAWEAMEYDTMLERLEIACSTNGTAVLPVQETSKKGLRKKSK